MHPLAGTYAGTPFRTGKMGLTPSELEAKTSISAIELEKIRSARRKEELAEAKFRATLRGQEMELEETRYQRQKDFRETIQKEQENAYAKGKYNLEKLLNMRTHVASSAELDIIDSQILGIGQRVKSLGPIIEPTLRISPRTELDLRGIEYDRQFGRLGPEPVMDKELETWENYGTRKLGWLEQKARRNSYISQRTVDAPSTIQIATAELEGIQTQVFAARREDGNVEVGTAESLFQLNDYAKHFNVSTQDIARWGNRVPIGEPVAGKINGKFFSRQQWMDLQSRKVVWDTTPIAGRTQSAAGVLPGSQPFDEEMKDLPVPASVQTWLEGLGAVNTGDPTAPVIGDLYKELLDGLQKNLEDAAGALPAGTDRQHLQRLLKLREAQAEEFKGISALTMPLAALGHLKSVRDYQEFLTTSPKEIHEAVGKVTQDYMDANINPFLPSNWTLRFVPHGAIEKLSLWEAAKGVMTGERGIAETHRGLTNFTTSQLGIGHFVAVHFNEVINLKGMGRYFVDDNDIIRDAYGRKQPFKRGDFEEVANEG